MVTRYIPQILALGVALVIVKLYGPSFNREATTIDDIKEYYDYIIGKPESEFNLIETITFCFVLNIFKQWEEEHLVLS